jgi:anti-sigma regulatory factor (Ser/Thr protein kinase)
MWQVVKPLRPHPLSVGQARNFCTRRLSSVLEDRASYEEAVADAATIASELVTNAVVAGSSAIELFIALHDSTVRIEVADDAVGTVVPADPSPTDTKGRGLVIVAALAREWGVSANNGNKQVWAEVDIPPRSATPIGSSL